MAIWSNDRRVVAGIVCLILGHYGIIIRSMFGAHSTWLDGAGCVTSNLQSSLFAAMYIYTMVFDFIIMSLTAYKLWYSNRGMQRSRMVKLLFKDGLIYFIVA